MSQQDEMLLALTTCKVRRAKALQALRLCRDRLHELEFEDHKTAGWSPAYEAACKILETYAEQG